VYPIGALDDVFTQGELSQFRNIRKKNNIGVRSVYTGDKDRPGEANAERVRIDSEKHPILCDITVYVDRVIISTLGKSLASFSIESRDLATTLKSLINLIIESKK